ncbi:hypothetical protein [uncultured Fibrella sp.]|uniref:hypothetical protein n=1 Tax=uncultured Fibrella sp. TaxID=1284596 RepID=UPI0035CB8CA0
MTPAVQFGLRVTLWSLLLAIGSYFSMSLNPFQGSVIFLFLLVAVIVQLVLLRKKGLRYVGAFLLCTVALTSLFIYLDDRLIDHPRRYYSIH